MNRISPHATIGPDVELGDGNIIEAGAVLQGRIFLGDDNYIASGARLGGISRERIRPHFRLDIPSTLEDARVEIGSNSEIFENVVIHQPMFDRTVIGDGVEIGSGVMIAHDCVIRDSSVLSPHVALGAYTTIGVGANLGLGVRVHNRLTIGAFAMCGLAAGVVGHVPPTAIVAGVPARIIAVNVIGLERAGYSEDVLSECGGALRSLEMESYPSELEEFVAAFSEDRVRWPTTKELVKWQQSSS